MEALGERLQEIYHGSFSTIGRIFGFGLLLVLIIVGRTLYLLRSIRKIRQLGDPRSTISPLSPSVSSAKSIAKPLKTLVVLGSGGHTTEMLYLIQNLNLDHYEPMVLVVATTDTTSLKRVAAYPHPLPIQDKNCLLHEKSSSRNGQQVYRIPRSREVGQSYWSSILTTLYSFLFALWLVGYQVRATNHLKRNTGMHATCLISKVAGVDLTRRVTRKSF